ARAGGTTGEWATALREVFGEYRAPTGVWRGTGVGRGSGRVGRGSGGAGRGSGDPGRGSGGPRHAETGDERGRASAKVRELVAKVGSPPRLLVAKPGLDGHSNGAEQIALAARDAGFEVVYQGIRLSPAAIAATARDEDVDVVGLSVLSGAHLELVGEVLDRLRAAGVDAPVVVGGIVPPDDAEVLRGNGVAAVYTPKDFQLGRIISELADLAARRRR
ncbi:MAG: cobalamin-dependent protein, partial [Acidimicrobiales bacterium]